ncbi:MAG: hypothetical protein ACLU38_14800 [Dysosmobacter sp.]
MISTSFMGTIQVNAFLACILGGFATFYGPIVGAVLIPVLSNCVGFLANFPAFYDISRWQMVGCVCPFCWPSSSPSPRGPVWEESGKEKV